MNKEELKELQDQGSVKYVIFINHHEPIIVGIVVVVFLKWIIIAHGLIIALDILIMHIL